MFKKTTPIFVLLHFSFWGKKKLVVFKQHAYPFSKHLSTVKFDQNIEKVVMMYNSWFESPTVVMTVST